MTGVSRLRARPVLAFVCVTASLLGGAIYLLRGSEGPSPVRATLSVAEALRDGSDAGFARALRPRAFSFPRDHGPHPGYRTEWWYYTGNLTTAAGRRFGFQLTFFRSALAAKPVARASAWGASQVYMAHFALTDVAGRRFHAVERVSRAALGLAGAVVEPGLASRPARADAARLGLHPAAGAAQRDVQPFRVWVEDWSAEGAGPGALPMRLRAAADGVAIDLTLRGARPVVLQGEGGLSRKGPEPGNASYYYSLTRMEARGTVTLGADAHRVAGLAWMDREWGTSALGADQVGWDWLALHLGDGRDVMFYRLRRRDGSIDRFSGGTLVAPDGSTRRLLPDEVRIETADTWRSPRSGAVYPSRWRFAIPAARLLLEVTPYLRDQELDLSVRYWEGAVAVTGTGAGRPITGDGYVELTGYDAAR